MTLRNGSLACENCRRRRIKCNQLRPRCSQCARAGLACSGYRAPLDLLFHDQTAIVSRKFRSRASKSSNARKTEDPVPDTPPPDAIIPYSIDLDVDEIASQVYFRNFNIPRVAYGSTDKPYPMLTPSGVVSVTSVGLAALAISLGDPHLAQLARRKYASALRLLARAVLDPAQLAQGVTATASFNLSIFEMILCDGPSVAYQWLKHVHGTAALLHLVTPPKEKTFFAVKGCVQVCYTVALAALLSERIVPQYVVDMVKSCAAFASTDDIPAIIELFILLSGLINFYVQAKHAHSKCPHLLIAALSDVDDALESWATRLPPAWVEQLTPSTTPTTSTTTTTTTTTTTIATTSTSSTTTTTTHGDNDDKDSCSISRFCGYYRLSRVLTHRLLLENMDELRRSPSSSSSSSSSSSPDTLDAKYEKSRRILSQLPLEIYASIPAMLKPSCYTTKKTCVPLSSDLFFLVVMLQCLLKLVGRESVRGVWSAAASERYGEAFGDTEEFISRRLVDVK